jgi:hypothetical protein
VLPLSLPPVPDQGTEEETLGQDVERCGKDENRMSRRVRRADELIGPGTAVLQRLDVGTQRETGAT